MKTKLIKVGNSKGVRIPKPMIEEAGLSDDIELILDDNRIILQSTITPRANWDEGFSADSESEGETVPYPYLSNDWDEEEWTW